ncbi:MAG: hypothetical protein ACI36T_07495 [Eggerthellaceae bacterium]|nr:hypothetical protein [Eggerthellaceae bacterium]
MARMVCESSPHGNASANFTCNDDGVYTWFYGYSLTKKSKIVEMVKTMGLLALISLAIITFALLIGSSSGLVDVIVENSFVYWLIGGVFMLSIPLSMLVYRGTYWYAYRADDTKITVLDAPCGSVSDEQIASSVGSAVYASGGDRFDARMMLDAYRAGRIIVYSSVKSLCRNDSDGSISIRGFMTLTKVYANPGDLDAVWNMLIEKCPNAKVG